MISIFNNMTNQKPTWIPLLVLLAIAVLALFTTSVPGEIPTEGLDTGDTAWMIVASGLVLLMTPGLAYFYGGMVNHKNVISTMLQSFIAMGVISVIMSEVFSSLSAISMGQSSKGEELIYSDENQQYPKFGSPTVFFQLNLRRVFVEKFVSNALISSRLYPPDLR